jgi:hypothetical protein
MESTFFKHVTLIMGVLAHCLKVFQSSWYKISSAFISLSVKRNKNQISSSFARPVIFSADIFCWISENTK